jgi:hypothetical protein
MAKEYMEKFYRKGFETALKADYRKERGELRQDPFSRM